MSLAHLIDDYADDAQSLVWQGTFRQYLEMVTENPQIARLSHARVYDMIMTYGVEKDAEGKITRYKFFDGEIFGSTVATHALVEYFKAAAHGMEVRKRILLLMGPAGGGKSSIVSLLKKRLEAYTRTPEGALYGIMGCPMHEEPLHLLPEELRRSVREKYGVHVEGDLCPVCHWRLTHEWGGDFRKAQVERVLFSEMGRTGIGTFSPSDPKCVARDTWILSDAGMAQIGGFAKPLPGPMVPDTFQRINLTVAGVEGHEQASHLYYNGWQQTRQIVTRLGYHLECTHVHPLLTVSDGKVVWRKAGALKTGDFVALQRGQRLFGNKTELPEWDVPAPNGSGSWADVTLPSTMTPELARLLGYAVADGSLDDHEIWITNSNVAVIEDIKAIAEVLFNLKVQVYPKERDHTCSIRIGSKTLANWLHKVCGLKRGAANKTIPSVILAAPEECVRSFLYGLFLDGCFRLRGNSNHFKYSTASAAMIEQVHLMLLNYGVMAARYVTPVNGVDYYEVQVSGDNAKTLFDVIGLPRAMDDARDETGRSNVDLIPKEMAPVVGALIGAAGGSRKEYYRLTRYAKGERSMTYDMLEEILQVTVPAIEAHATLSDLADKRFLWLPIESIEESENEVYDLTVPGTHSFCGNGFVNHNTQDVGELIGSMDLAKIGQIGSESDPRAWRFDGELNIANRGIMEFIELLKSDPKFLYLLLNLAQEQRIKAPRYPLIYADEIVISHTNEAEFTRFLGEKTNEALQDRMHVVRVPYNLAVSDEERIHDKLLRQGSIQIHLAPNTTRVAAMFGVLTRLEDVESKKKLTLTDKMKLYDGQKLEGWTGYEIKTLHDESPREGMEGAGPRFIVDALAKALSQPDTACLNPVAALRGIMDHLDHHPHIDGKKKELYKNHIGRVRDVYHDALKKSVMAAFVTGFQEQAKGLVGQYLAEINAWRKKDKVHDPVTGQPRDPDEKFMRAVEEQISVSQAGAKEFREEIVARVADLALSGKTFDYSSHDRLREAVERKLFADVKSIVKTVVTSKVLDKDQQQRVDRVIETLKGQGYCEHCARATLQYLSRIID